MQQKTILVLAYSHIGSDPRVMRQINALKESYSIVTCGYSPAKINTIEFISIYKQPRFSLIRKIKRLLQFTFRQYDKYYWDDGKIALKNKLVERNFDLIIANDIPTLPLAIAIAGSEGKVLFDAHEYHPEEFQDIKLWRILHQPYIQFLCKKYITKATAFTTVANGLADKYKEFLGLKPEVITNATEYKNLAPVTVNPEQIKLVHHGAAIQGRKIESMIDMMDDLGNGYTLHLMLTGKDTPYYKLLSARAAKHTNVFFLDPVPLQEIVKTINQFDIGVYNLPCTNFNNTHALPNKFFEFIQARLALVISPNPEMANLINQHSLGVVSADYTTTGMAREIKKLSAQEIYNYKENCHRAAKLLSAEQNILKISKIVSSLSQS